MYKISRTFTFMHLADAFIQRDLVHSGCTFFFISMCSWELNPQPFALITQCSTTEPQEHLPSHTRSYILWPATWERADQSGVEVYSRRWATQHCLTGTRVTPASGYSFLETTLHGFRPLAPVPCTISKGGQGGLETGCLWRGADVPYHVEDRRQAMFMSLSHILSLTNKKIYIQFGSSSLLLAQWNVKRILIQMYSNISIFNKTQQWKTV